MDYSPITAGRVLMAFGLTAFVGILPLLAVVLNDTSAVGSALSTPDGYGGITLGLGIIAVAVALIGLTRLASATWRRVVGRTAQA